MLLADSAFKCHSPELHFDLVDDALPLLGLAMHDLIQKLQNGCLLAARLAQQVSTCTEQEKLTWQVIAMASKENNQGKKRTEKGSARTEPRF